MWCICIPTKAFFFFCFHLFPRPRSFFLPSSYSTRVVSDPRGGGGGRGGGRYFILDGPFPTRVRERKRERREGGPSFIRARARAGGFLRAGKEVEIRIH